MRKKDRAVLEKALKAAYGFLKRERLVLEEEKQGVALYTPEEEGGLPVLRLGVLPAGKGGKRVLSLMALVGAMEEKEGMARVTELLWKWSLMPHPGATLFVIPPPMAPAYMVHTLMAFPVENVPDPDVETAVALFFAATQEANRMAKEIWENSWREAMSPPLLG